MSGRTVLISGAGIAGPTLAYWLRQAGFAPTIVERAPALRTSGYMIDFWGVGYDVAERMGLLPVIVRDGYLLSEVRVVDADGQRVSGFDASVFRSATNKRFISLPRGDLARYCYELIAGDTETRFSDTISALEEGADGVRVTFRRGQARTFDLVIGADGLHSNVRKLTFGPPERFEKYLGYYTAAFSLPNYPHRDKSAYVMYSTPGRQVARYALRDGSSAFFFMFAQAEPLPLAHDDTAGHKRALQQRFAGTGWETDEILGGLDATDDLYFDQVAQVRLGTWSRGRVALVGDAAYCPSLLAGQGSALAMAGAYLLAQELGTAEGDYAPAFAAYERTLRPFVEGKQKSAERFGGWFAPRTAFGIKVRNLVTRLFNLPVLGEVMVARSVGDHPPKALQLRR